MVARGGSRSRSPANASSGTARHERVCLPTADEEGMTWLVKTPGLQRPDRSITASSIPLVAIGRPEASTSDRCVSVDAPRRKVSSHVPGVSEGVPARLRPYADPMGLVPDGDAVHRARAGIEDIDDVVIAAAKPQLPSVGGDVAHVGAAAGGDAPCRDDSVV